MNEILNDPMSKALKAAENLQPEQAARTRAYLAGLHLLRQLSKNDLIGTAEYVRAEELLSAKYKPLVRYKELAFHTAA